MCVDNIVKKPGLKMLPCCYNNSAQLTVKNNVAALFFCGAVHWSVFSYRRPTIPDKTFHQREVEADEDPMPSSSPDVSTGRKIMFAPAPLSFNELIIMRVPILQSTVFSD